MSIYNGLYDLDFIKQNPISARCKKCAYEWTDGKLVRWITPNGETRQRICQEAIRSPTLENCTCFWCHGVLVPIDRAAYKARLRSLHLYHQPEQLKLPL